MYVGRAGATRHQHHAGLAGGARVTFGGVRRALLMAAKHMNDLVILEQRVVDRQHSTTRITEDVLDALILQRADHHLGAAHFDRARLHALHCPVSVHANLPEKRKGRRRPLVQTANRKPRSNLVRSAVHK